MNTSLFFTAAAVAIAIAAAASAGECPADQVARNATNGDGHAENLYVTDSVLAVNDLGAHFPELASRDQRIRFLTVAPGGEVAWHEHGDRPALIYILTGEIVEHRSTCAVPIVHRAGEVAAEIGSLSHWWKNEASEPVTLISTDLPRAAADDDGMM